MTHCVSVLLLSVPVTVASGVESCYCIVMLVIILLLITILNDELELSCTLNLPNMVP